MICARRGRIGWLALAQVGGYRKQIPFCSPISRQSTMADEKLLNVLFLCTHNSARSILGEAIINYVGRGKFKGHSAGSHPATHPNPLALATLKRLRFPSEGFRSKNWEEFAKPGAPKMDFVITVCDTAAKEICPVWPGQPITAHWGVEDPSLFEGTAEQKMKEFAKVALILKRRIELFTSLPLAKLDRLKLQRKVRDIGNVRQ
jgi:arsenate reductase (thioredoxin)